MDYTVVSGVLAITWYRFRAAFRRRWTAYAGLAVVVGVLGGTGAASIAAARRTQSAYPRFLSSTRPSDLTVSVYGTGPDSPASSYSAALTAAIRHMAGVKRVESWVGLPAAPLNPDGSPNINPAINPSGSVDGLHFDMDRATAIRGRLADPRRPDEFVTTAGGAQVLGMHVGQTVPVGSYTNAQTNLPGFGTAQVPPAQRLDMTLVGLVVFNDEVIQDDVDRFPTKMLFTPAFTRTNLGSDEVQGTWYGLQLAHGSRDVSAVERALINLFPAGAVYNFRVSSLAEAKVERAIKPEAIALGIFGAIAALAGLAIAAQMISRQLRAGDEDVEVMRALGAGPLTLAADQFIGIFGALVLGALFAGLVAAGLSPLAPLGPVRRVYPSRGIAFDWTVIAGAFVVVAVGLGAAAAVLALASVRRGRRRSDAQGRRSSAVVAAVASSGLSTPGVVGVRFALEPGRGRTAVPVRSALSGAAVAVLMVVATLTFGSGLRTLVSHPALYGWNWDYALTSVNGVPPQALASIAHDPDIAGWAGYLDLNAQIDGQNVPVLVGDDSASVSPPILSGHAVTAKDEVVLGAATLARLHKRVGDAVVASYATPRDAPYYIPATRVRVVGTATLPAVAGSGSFADHTSMGTGAVFSSGIAPVFRQASRNPDPTQDGPPVVFLRMHPGVSSSAAAAAAKQIATAGNKAFAADPNTVGDTVAVIPVQRPAEIVNYRSTGAAPEILASGLAAGAIAALGLTLAASVRRRRRDLALLKTLGFTSRQLAATVAWQASIAALLGVVVGVPLGIAGGRWLWILFAHQIYAVPKPTVPALSVALVGIGAVVLANVVSALPGRAAARTAAALVLRSE